MKTTMLSPLKINSWKEEALSALAAKISDSEIKPLILIDRAAGSGKTTLADSKKIQSALTQCCTF